MGDIEFSVILPVYNETDVLGALHERLVRVMGGLERPYEILFVDDGSTDGSAEVLDAFHQANPSTKVAHLSRNFGQEAAVAAGMSLAAGQAVVLMDADLQDPPEVIPQLAAEWRNGAQVVYAERSRRGERLVKRWAIKTFHRVFGRVSATGVRGDVGLFSLLDRRVADRIVGMPERNRYLTGLRAFTGFRQVAVPYDRPDRAAGRPSQTWGRLIRQGLNAIFGFSYVPLRLVTVLGLVVFVVASVFAVGMVIVALAGTATVPGWTWAMVLASFLGGVQLLALGIVGEYIVRIYDEAKRRPYFIVDRMVGIESTPSGFPSDTHNG